MIFPPKVIISAGAGGGVLSWSVLHPSASAPVGMNTMNPGASPSPVLCLCPVVLTSVFIAHSTVSVERKGLGLRQAGVALSET